MILINNRPTLEQESILCKGVGPVRADFGLKN